ncbi:MAG TPA: ATP-binding protein [Bryobacteraceae bacterium]|jgi:two-component system phosphate regulon sensor histidine kinase PhoR
MTARIFIKLLLAGIGVLIIALAAVDFLTARVTEKFYVNNLKQDLAEKGRMLVLLHPDFSRTSAAELARSAGVRVTWIASDGSVLQDSDANPAKMENHGARPEVAEALKGEIGSATRKSATLGVDTLYVAVPSSNGALRLSVPLSRVEQQVAEIRKEIFAAATLAFVPSILLAALVSRDVSRRLAAIIDYAGKLARGEFAARLERTGTGELGQLGRKLNETGQNLERMVKELDREHSELEKLERVRKDFVINVSHELRTPLASIQGYTETLLDGAVHEPGLNVRFLGIIRQNAERLARITGDLLTLSRIELGRHKFQFASYYVNRLIEDSVESVRLLAEKRDIALHVQPGPPESDVFCDSEAVHQILGNLLDNAIKYTPEGGSVFAGAEAPGEDGKVRIWVRDTGPGIPPDDLPRLFERFYRVDKARSREMGGTGLGLAIVKHLVRAQGGDVTVESIVNKGSTFTFTLPVHDTGQPDETPAQSQLSVRGTS